MVTGYSCSLAGRHMPPAGQMVGAIHSPITVQTYESASESGDTLF